MGATGVVKLFEDPSTQGLVAVKFFESKVTQVSDDSLAFFREIDALVVLTHPCVVQIVGYCLATEVASTYRDRVCYRRIAARGASEA
jgi:serine/threonine protein kinase